MTLRLFARARETAGRAEDQFDAATVGDVLAAARVAYGAEFTDVLERARVWVNGDEPADGEATRLRDGDEVAVIPPVSGGAGADTSPAELEAAGLYDPDGEHAESRLELLLFLLELGATMDDLDEARDELPFLASVLPLRPGRERLTLTEVARRAGTSLDQATRIWRASGLPAPGRGDRVCTEADVDVVQLFVAGEELLGEEVVLQIGRVVGAAVARVAEAARSAFLVNVGAPRLVEDPTGLALARANADAVTLVSGLSHALDVVLRHHFELNSRPVDISSGAARGYDAQELTVGFVDLVGSTALAEQLSIGELGAALGEFEGRAADAVGERGGRLVKMIGDEAMFVVGDPGTACDIALALVGALASHAVLPPARGGLAAGEVLVREGDYFGPVVNLAARAVKAAAPGRVVVSATVRNSVEGRAFTSVGTQSLRGIDAPVELFQLEPAS
ncbi:MAG: MoaD/ThiS family protein [Actinomycetota bacterium]